MKKKFLNSWVVSIAVLLIAGGYSLAQGPVATDLLNVPFGTLFAQVASLVAALNLVGLAAKSWFKLADLALYSTVMIAGLVAGVAGQYAGVLTAADYVNVPAPWGGVAFGLTAGLQAVGLNQGKRQVLGESGSKGVAPNKNAPTPTLPQSG